MRDWILQGARMPRVRLVAGVAGVLVLLIASGIGIRFALEPAAQRTAGGAGGHGAAGDSPSGAPGASPSAAGAGAGGTTPGPGAAPPAAAAAPAHFKTLPPGTALPSGAQCAAWVRARPSAENKRVNLSANQVTGQHVGTGLFPASDDPLANQRLAPRIDGQFTGTTHEILRWTACKWGVDEDLVAAQAAAESWWRQPAMGDWSSDATACAPGHGLGADGRPGQCPQSYGILQNRYPYERSTWPGIATSTAMSADTAYAIWRVCFEGYETWLNDVERGQQYAAGDAWGCVGRWFAGRWHTQPAQDYVVRVQGYLNQRIWEQRDFQEP